MKRHRRPAFACGLLVVLPLLWWWPVFAGYLPDFMDTVAHGYPMRMAAARQLRTGTLPLWLPNVFSGMPLAANMQLTVWYPPQIVFYLWPSTYTYGLFAILHYIIGGLGMFAWVRRLRPNTAAALFAAFTFQFGSMLVSRIALLPHVLTVVWIPWMFWSIEKAAREPGWLPGRGTLFVAVFFALQLLGGSPQITYYTGIALPLYWISRRVMVTRGKGGFAPVAQTLSHGLCAAILGVMIAGIQILPMLDFAGETTRSSISVERLSGQGLNDGFIWRSLVGFTGPFIEDTDSINAIGVGALLLVPLAFVRRRATAIVLFVIGGLGFSMALGGLTPFWSRLLPLFDGFHAPRRALILWSVAGPAIAGVGAANLLAFLRLRRLPRSVGFMLLLVLSGGTVWMLPRLDRVWTKEERFQPDDRIVELMGTDRFLVLDPTLRYSYDSRRFDFGRSMAANMACLHDTMAVNGYDPLISKNYDLARRVASARSGNFYPSHGVYFTDPNSPVLEMLNVQYLVGRWDLFEPGRLIPGTGVDKAQLAERIEPAAAHPRWPVYRFVDERPFAWVPKRVVSVESDEDALVAAVGNGPREFAFNTSGIDMTNSDSLKVSGRYLDARTVEVAFESPPSSECLVAIALPSATGWHVRGSATSVLMRVNGFITGVLVPAGTESAVLRYTPSSWLRGALLTLAGLSLLLLGGAASARLTGSRP